MKLGINKKIIGAQGIGLVLFLLLTIFSYVSLSFYSSIQKGDVQLAYRMELISDLQLLIEKLLMPANDYIITGDAKERADFAALVTETASLFEKIRSNGNRSTEEVQIEKDLEKGIITLEQSGMVILATSNPVGNRELGKAMKEFDSYGQALEEQAEKLHSLIKLEMREHAKNAANITTWTPRIFIFLIAVFLTVMGLLILMVIKGVTRPISVLTDAVQIFGQGNLDHQIKIKTGDEIETLGLKFNDMAHLLKEKINEVQKYSAELAVANRKLDQNILQLYTLYNISKTISVTFETDKLLTEISKEVEQSLKIHKINIMLIDADRTGMYVAAGLGIPDELIKRKILFEENIYSRVTMTGIAEIINNPSENHLFKPITGVDDNVSSMIIAPFKGRGNVIGLLNAYKTDGALFDNAAFELLVAAANQIGMTLENARLFEETKTLAITDGMTSLYNHRYFIETLRSEFERAKRYKRALSLIMIDIDFFKKFNDAHGHQGGDEVLKGVARALKKRVRTSDIVARYGGEEFAIILPESNLQSAVTLAEGLRTEIESIRFPGAETQPLGKITLSLGVASCIDGMTENIDMLIKNADDALYRAKEEGRNRVCS
ncbi:diguanylate cyclase [bacterium]|nr:MAG: diguanylate cyclase [bacterium]